MNETSVYDILYERLQILLVPGMISHLGSLLLRRMQIIPGSLSTLGLIKEYLWALAFPMDPIRDYITQFVEIKSAGGMQGHAESVLRSAYAGNGYLVDACPKNTNIVTFKKDTVFTEASPPTRFLTSVLHKHTVKIPSDCVLLTKVREQDASLIIKQRFSVSQGRITQDDTTTTKVCALVILLACAYAVPAYFCGTYIWRLPSGHEPYLSAFINNAIIFSPLFYTFGKCIAPVFITLESDQLSLNPDFTLLSEPSSCENLSEKPSETKDVIERKVKLRYLLEKTIGSMVYTVLYVMLAFATESPMYWFTPEIGWVYSYQPQPVETFFPIIETIIHNMLCLNALAMVYFTDRKTIAVLTFTKAIFSVIYFFVRVLVVLYNRYITLKM
ncbi:hypothetical protein K493DRAFT_301710 [Basidiobolus meristosporus CBS 931.73]|uniref:Uncharacterized protein n=1 Tax=Basidiobolus meristosporus CBS 931.73 TaxID=1314790 RepID=A0A1Y1YAI6_9FUNG|nr:hypothetical protein K493DRAFT_301710 [Basidiobolus meristosporus CBS 931.73]|eukprot:ORX95031.1 hypothetical protein K493DRAFT_301710 [Basidiobolus meristosporus CBS 931.73]